MSARLAFGSLLVAMLIVALVPACQQEVTGPGCPGGTCPNASTKDQAPPRLYADPPFGVGFDCVSVGCEDTRIFRVENRGEGELAITVIRLSVDSSSELSLSLSAPGPGAEEPRFPTAEAPLFLSAGAGVDVVVHYQPMDADRDRGALWIDWYDGGLEYEDAVVERVELPISTRVLGDPEAEQGPSDVSFGFVAPGESRTAYLEVTNATAGSAVLELSEPQLAQGSDFEFMLEHEGGAIFVNPGETLQIPVRFEPTATDWFEAVVYVLTNDGARPQLTYTLRGTAIRDPFFVLEEPGDWRVDFGEVRVGGERTRQVSLRNLGGQPLQVTATLPVADGVRFQTPIPLDVPLPPIAPLGSVRFDVSAAPELGGELTSEMRFSTNDPTLPEDWIDLVVYGVFPDVGVSATALDFGDIVQTWTAPAQPLQIANSGNGELTVSGIEWEVGSSSQVRLASVPNLPIKLRAGESPLELSVFVEALALGPANATLLVHTDAVNEPTRRIAVLANVVSCQEGCPLQSGTPSCTSGRCEVGTCAAGHHDTDRSFDTGCECTEDSTPQGNLDLGDFCSTGANVGPLADNCGNGTRGWVERTGTLHTEGDEDLYYFHADDGGSFLSCDSFGDSFKARVQLVNPPPGVEFCVRPTGGGGGCGGENQRQCGLTSWSSDSGWLSDGDIDVTVWVRRVPGAPPMCESYEVRFCANDDAC